MHMTPGVTYRFCCLGGLFGFECLLISRSENVHHAGGNLSCATALIAFSVQLFSPSVPRIPLYTFFLSFPVQPRIQL